ncbi:hypothetical protein ACS0TY_003322 [Phlomoides rotata]
MLVHLAREKYENNLRIPKSLEKVSVLFADWYNIYETSDHFFLRIMELSVSNCVSSEEMKPQSHQGQQISFLLLLRFCPVDQGSSKLSLLPKCLMVQIFSFAWLELVSHGSFMPKLLTANGQKGWPYFQRLLVDLFQFMEPCSSWIRSLVNQIFYFYLILFLQVHFLYKGTHTHAFSVQVDLGTFLLRYVPNLLRSLLVEIGLSEDMYDPLLILLLVALLIFGSWLGFWFVRKLLLTDDGSIDSGASHFISWSIRIVASVLILQSSIDPLLAAEALVGRAFVSSLLRRCGHPKVVRRVYK